MSIGKMRQQIRSSARVFADATGAAMRGKDFDCSSSIVARFPLIDVMPRDVEEVSW